MGFYALAFQELYGLLSVDNGRYAWLAIELAGKHRATPTPNSANDGVWGFPET